MSTEEFVFAVTTWLIFGIALVWSISLVNEMIQLILHACQDRDFEIDGRYLIIVGVSWSVFGFLITFF